MDAQSPARFPSPGGDLTPWQRRRALELTAFLLCAWYTTFNPLPDIPYGPVQVELMTWLLAVGLLAWWLALGTYLAGRSLLRQRAR